jgi:hypothetical protein
MGGTLRVDPAALRDAARAQTDVGGVVSGLDVGTSMSGAGQFVGAVVDSALGAVGEELNSHSEKLARAADLYEQSDAKSGDSIRRLVR